MIAVTDREHVSDEESVSGIRCRMRTLLKRKELFLWELLSHL